ncbi:MAG: hypothetical protein K8T89_22300 [Planctomycetes bacterium]|nr:hypothetical protein [Planctomycetota bacterium]
MSTTRVFLCLLALTLPLVPVRGDEASIIKLLKEKGAEITETKGVATSLTLADGSKLTDAEFRQIGQLTHLKSLQLSKCLNDQTLGYLTGLAELETIQTNLMEVSDDGIKQFAQLKKLKNLKFFHPGKTFTGKGMAALADMPNLEALTVAGSFTFGDDGMAAVGKLTQLKSLRTWHAGQTNEGIKHLKNLKNLKTLHLGQRLTYKPPSCLSDETIAILAELKSLESLQIEEARLKLSALTQLKQLPELKTLTLGGIDIPETDVDLLKKELPKVAIKWTKPTDVYMKRINAFAGK